MFCEAFAQNINLQIDVGAQAGCVFVESRGAALCETYYVSRLGLQAALRDAQMLRRRAGMRACWAQSCHGPCPRSTQERRPVQWYLLGRSGVQLSSSSGAASLHIDRELLAVGRDLHMWQHFWNTMWPQRRRFMRFSCSLGPRGRKPVAHVLANVGQSRLQSHCWPQLGKKLNLFVCRWVA